MAKLREEITVQKVKEMELKLPSFSANFKCRSGACNCQIKMQLLNQDAIAKSFSSCFWFGFPVRVVLLFGLGLFFNCFAVNGGDHTFI
jgi:hypothetical protein